MVRLQDFTCWVLFDICTRKIGRNITEGRMKKGKEGCKELKTREEFGKGMKKTLDKGKKGKSENSERE